MKKSISIRMEEINTVVSNYSQALKTYKTKVKMFNNYKCSVDG